MPMTMADHQNEMACDHGVKDHLTMEFQQSSHYTCKQTNLSRLMPVIKSYSNESQMEIPNSVSQVVIPGGQFMCLLSVSSSK